MSHRVDESFAYLLDTEIETLPLALSLEETGWTDQQMQTLIMPLLHAHPPECMRSDPPLLQTCTSISKRFRSLFPARSTLRVIDPVGFLHTPEVAQELRRITHSMRLLLAEQFIDRSCHEAARSRADHLKQTLAGKNPAQYMLSCSSILEDSEELTEVMIRRYKANGRSPNNGH